VLIELLLDRRTPSVINQPNPDISTSVVEPTVVEPTISC
jgi:hypothetical protein